MRLSPQLHTDSFQRTSVCCDSSSYSLFLDRPSVREPSLSTRDLCTPRMGHRAVFSAGRLAPKRAMTLRGGLP